MYEMFIRRFRRKYIFLFFISFFSVIIASTLVRKDYEYGGILAISLSMIPLVQIMSKLIEIEEIKEERLKKNIISRHKEFIKNYFAIFFGASIGFYISALLYPEIFKIQIKSIYDIWRSFYQGSFYNKDLAFSIIILNNLKVLILVFLFSFIFGAGAIYIILFNASILGVYLYLSTMEYGDKGILIKYIFGPLYNLLKLLPHGIFEFTAFFLSALAGGILSISIIKNLDKRVLYKLWGDSILLFVLSIVVLVWAAFVEAYL